jgi:molybdenum ABC transporter molybdate-binding protein
MDRRRMRLEGRLLLDTDSGVCLSPQKRRIGLVTQEYTLFPHMTLRENVEFAYAGGTGADGAPGIERHSPARGSAASSNLRWRAPAGRAFPDLGDVSRDALAGRAVFRAGRGKSHPFASEFILGRGRRVLAAARGVGAPSLALLDSANVKRIAFPDAKVAIYGIAATEYLQNSGKRDRVEGKLVQVGTVPQVSAYLMSGEVDLGFINRTDAMAIEDKIEGFVEVPESLYSPIYIVARTLPGAPSADAALRFGHFLERPEVRAVVEKHGL